MNDVRLISCITVIILLGIVFVGTEWESKTQMVLLVILLAAMANFMIGSVIPPTPEKMSKGFLGYSSKLANNIFIGKPPLIACFVFFLNSRSNLGKHEAGLS